MAARRTKLCLFTGWILVIVMTLLRIPTTNSLRVAVLGSGISGSTAARTLADRGHSVTVFEAGYGIGGRTSTRITRDEFRYQFDHGAQYIGKPKTAAFTQTLNEWKDDDWVEEWPGRFLLADGEGVAEEETKERFVGYPAMHSVCRNLLHHKNVRVKLQTRADARRTEEGRWELTHGKTKKLLGEYDWLVASDRNSAAFYRKDLSSADVGGFTSAARRIKSVKSLTAMVAFETSLGLGADGVTFSGDRFGALGWAACDSSKPGRGRGDGRECWVLQSRPGAAEGLLKGKKKVGEVREMAKEVLVRDFLAAVPFLVGAGVDGGELPRVVSAVGHRWGAAFPILPEDLVGMECQLIPEKQFVACGDYFGKLPGRVEGAYLSGVAAADRLCGEIEA